ncbi:MAG: hypothetical protein OEZ35_00475 [Candidatus Bathyarchaeota archaeon]|nr:hypothetical protein [Candidatus Bathyarchaeota archaeon]
MVLYVAYKASRESKGRSLLPHRLRALGCRQLHKSFWEVEEEKVSKVLKVLEKNQSVLLKRVREIRKPRFVKNRDISELGSLVIVMYATPREAKREQIKNFLSKASCIRLCRSVYAFSQNHSLFDKDNELVDAFKFAELIKGIQEDVKVIPRVVIVNADSCERLLEETRERIEGEISDIVRGCKELYDRALSVEYDVPHIRDTLSKNRRRFIAVKKAITFYEKWLRMDFSRSLMKSYRAIEKVNSVVNKNRR